MTDSMILGNDETDNSWGFLEIHVDKNGNRFLLWDDNTNEYVRLTEGAYMKEVDRVQLYPNDRPTDLPIIDVKDQEDPIYSPEQIDPFAHDKETSSVNERMIDAVDHWEDALNEFAQLPDDPDLYRRVHNRPMDTGIPHDVCIPGREATNKEFLL